MDINEIAIPLYLFFIINLFFCTTQPVIVSVVFKTKIHFKFHIYRPFRGFPNVSSYFYILID